jgi:hypothetical protein
LPSIEQVMPWLHLIFDAWEEHRRAREATEQEASELEAATQEALTELNDDSGEPYDDDDDRREKPDKKKKRRKDKK